MDYDLQPVAQHIKRSILPKEVMRTHNISTEWSAVSDFAQVRFIHPTGRTVTVRQTDSPQYRWVTMQRPGSQATTSILARSQNIRGYVLGFLIEGKVPHGL